MDAAQILEDAADLLLIHGRCTGKGLDDAGRMCVRGAILAAAGERPTQVFGVNSPGVGALEAYLARHPEIHADYYMTEGLGSGNPDHWAGNLASGRWPAWIWNDDPTTTDDEVRDTLLLAAKDLRNEATS